MKAQGRKKDCASPAPPPCYPNLRAASAHGNGAQQAVPTSAPCCTQAQAPTLDEHPAQEECRCVVVPSHRPKPAGGRELAPAARLHIQQPQVIKVAQFVPAAKHQLRHAHTWEAGCAC